MKIINSTLIFYIIRKKTLFSECDVDESNYSVGHCSISTRSTTSTVRERERERERLMKVIFLKSLSGRFEPTTPA